jgi:hypothetical protein
LGSVCVMHSDAKRLGSEIGTSLECNLVLSWVA